MLAVLGLGCTYPLADTPVGGIFDFVNKVEAANDENRYKPVIFLGREGINYERDDYGRGKADDWAVLLLGIMKTNNIQNTHLT